MFKVLILICAIGTDHSACTKDTAIDVVRGPTAQTMSQCIHESQVTLAQTSIAPQPGKQYIKIVCAGTQSS
jgi:hypothetical protein